MAIIQQISNRSADLMNTGNSTLSHAGSPRSKSIAAEELRLNVNACNRAGLGLFNPGLIRGITISSVLAIWMPSTQLSVLTVFCGYFIGTIHENATAYVHEINSPTEGRPYPEAVAKRFH